MLQHIHPPAAHCLYHLDMDLFGFPYALNRV